MADHRSMDHDRNGLEVLGHVQCIKLLSSATFGRIGLLVDGLPVVLPINLGFPPFRGGLRLVV